MFQSSCQKDLVSQRTKPPPMLDPVVAAKQRALDNAKAMIKDDD